MPYNQRGRRCILFYLRQGVWRPPRAPRDYRPAYAFAEASRSRRAMEWNLRQYPR